MSEANHANPRSPYEVDLAYPPIRPQTASPAVIRMIRTDYAGRVSEMSAINSYVFRHLIAEKPANSRYADVAKAFIKIGIVEMHHLEIFGNLLTGMGASPQYYALRGSQPEYWNGRFINYDEEMKKMLRNSIAEEKEAISQYSRQAAVIQDKNIRLNLRRIILDEELHVRILENLYAKYFEK